MGFKDPQGNEVRGEVLTHALVVDDSQTIRLRMTDLLRPLLGPGSVIDEAADARTALECFTRDPPDLVFLDMMLPDGRASEPGRIASSGKPSGALPSTENGVAVLDRILETRPSTRVVVITGLSRDHSGVIRALSRGAVAYLRKPISAEALASVLQENGAIRRGGGAAQ